MTTANAPAPPTTRATVELFYVVTVEKEISARFVKHTLSNNIKVQPGMRTQDLYELILDRLMPEPFRGGNVITISIFPAVIA